MLCFYLFGLTKIIDSKVIKEDKFYLMLCFSNTFLFYIFEHPNLLNFRFLIYYL